MKDKPIKTEAQITVAMPIEEARLFRELCMETGMSITNAARRAIRAYIPAMQRMAKEFNAIDSGLVAAAENDTAVNHAQ